MLKSWTITYHLIAVAIFALIGAQSLCAANSDANTSSPAPKPATEADISAAAKRIDALIDANLRANNISANKSVSDMTFARRLYLDVIGRIPSAKEMEEFQNLGANRREKLLDQLFASEGYQSHMYNWLGDMFRVRSFVNRVDMSSFQAWLKKALRDNMSWDVMVSAMISAEGTLNENGATGLLIHDAGMPMDAVSNTLNVFLGANVSCAQCHDHPFADWTQRDFLSMTAFLGTTQNDNVDVRKVADKYKSVWGKMSRAGMVSILSPNVFRLVPDPDSWTVFPDDYKYKDAKPGDKVKPEFITWGKEKSPAYVPVDYKNRDSLRSQFASWLTHPENPRFAMAIANRLWKKMFGLGVKEPVIDLDDPELASNPALLRQLAEEMRRLNFDLRAFQRLLVSTKAYQRQASNTPSLSDPAYQFPGPLVRRMTAQQIWDSFMTLKSGSEVDKHATNFDDKIAQLTIPGGNLNNKTVADLVKRAGEHDHPKNRASMTKWRASELRQPEMDSHMLRALGQSDRLVIDDGSVEGGINQALLMMNSDAIEDLTKKSYAMQAAQNAGGTDRQIESLYISILGRLPTSSQQQAAASAIRNGLSISAVAWALLNSREFIFIQ